MASKYSVSPTPCKCVSHLNYSKILKELAEFLRIIVELARANSKLAKRSSPVNELVELAMGNWRLEYESANF